jgi:serine-type anaerobic sulfatase-maturating enzyme
VSVPPPTPPRRPDQRVQHTIQTNGTLLDDAWGAFLAEHGFLVGLSMDGPADIHDTYRLNKGGRGTFGDVRRGWETLRRHGVEVNILCTVHAANAEHGVEVYRFFRDDLGARYLQLIPIVERATADTLAQANAGWSARSGGARPLYTQAGDRVTGRSVTAEQYGRFLIAIFDEWVRRDVGTVFVQMFDSALANWAGEPGAVCVHQETCGLALALEHNGDVYSCDHFVEPRHRLGSIRERHLIELVSSDRQRRFGNAKRDGLPRQCRSCDVRFACHGGCPKDRFVAAPDGESGLNYLCAGYQAFFHHVDAPMRRMADLLRQGRAPAEVMRDHAPAN